MPGSREPLPERPRPPNGMCASLPWVPALITATPARIRETIELNGPDIYHTTTVNRTVYTIRGTVKQGNSGGPMIDTDGKVLGVVFGAAVDDADTGFVLTAEEVLQQRLKVGNTAPVPTGRCIS